LLNNPSVPKFFKTLIFYLFYSGLALGLALSAPVLAGTSEWKGEFALTRALRQKLTERFLSGSPPAWNALAFGEYHQEIRTRLEQIKSLQRPISLQTVRAYELLDQELKALSESPPDLARLVRAIEVDEALKSAAPHGPVLRSVLNFSASHARWTISRGSQVRREAQNLGAPPPLQSGPSSADDWARLNPPENSPFWRPLGLSDIHNVSDFYYRGGSPLHQGLELRFPEAQPAVDFMEILPPLPGTPHPAPQLAAEFFDRQTGLHSVRIKFRSKVHSDPTVSVLATLLGYSTPVFKHYPELKVYLRNTSLRQFKIDYLDQLDPQNIAQSLEMDPNIVAIGKDQRGEFIRLKEVVVEAVPREHLELGTWDTVELGHDQLREVRGFELFQLWVGNIEAGSIANTRLVLRNDASGVSVHPILRDLGGTLGGVVPETPASLPWTLIQSASLDQVEFSHRSAVPNPLRGKLTEADAIWATRLIGRLSKNQIQQAVELGAWPSPVAQLITEKLCHRRNQLVQVFGLESELGLLDANPTLTTPDGLIVKGRLTQSRFEGSIHEYDHEAPRLQEARLAALKVAAARLAQLGTSAVGFTQLAEFELGSTVGLISEGLIKLDRNIEQNPTPRDESERFLVQDIIKVGLRLGAGLVVSGQATLWHQYKLVYPVRTESEAVSAGNFPVNLLMPYQLWKGDFPERFVLMTESAIEGGGRVDLRLPGALPLSLDMSQGLLTLARATVERDSAGNFKVFKDRELSLRSQYRLLGEALGLFRAPLLQREDHHLGSLNAKVWNIPFDQLLASSEVSSALLQVVRIGNTDSLEQILSDELKPITFEGSFSRSSTKWSWLGLISGSKSFEFLKLWGDSFGNREQYRTSNDRHWGLLDWSEDHSVRAELLSSSSEIEQSLQNRKILKIRWKIDDQDTSTEELEDGYLVLLNRLAGENAVTLKPGLFSRNQKWSRTLTHMELDYGPDALARLQTLTPEAYWSALAEVLGVSREEVQKLQNAKDLILVQRRGRRAQPTKISPEARAVSESKDFVSKIWGWSGNRPWDWGHFMETLNHSFRSGTLTQRSWILQTLNQFIGKQHIRFLARIAPPYGAESLFPGAQPIEYRREGANAPPEGFDPLLIFAETPLELYRFFDAFSSIKTASKPL